jgi:hypothetical protein
VPALVVLLVEEKIGVGPETFYGSAAVEMSITLFWSSTLFQSTELLTEVTVYNK